MHEDRRRAARGRTTNSRGVRAVLALITAAAVVTVGLVGVHAMTPTGAVTTGEWEPPPRTVVKVTGNKRYGFRIYRYNGSVDHPPTLSEVYAECGVFHRRTRRVRCRTKARIWYRDLRRMKHAIRYARSR